MSRTLSEVRKSAITSGSTLVGTGFKPRPRLELVDTVIGTAIQANEMRPANPRHGKKVESLPYAWLIESYSRPQAQHIPLLNDLLFLRLRMTQNLLGLQIARQLKPDRRKNMHH